MPRPAETRTVTRTVAYTRTFSAALLRKRLNLPDDARLKANLSSDGSVLLELEASFTKVKEPGKKSEETPGQVA